MSDLPREAVSPILAQRIQRHVRLRSLSGRVGHALPISIATLTSALLFLWLAGETWLAFQDRALWEVVGWFVSVPELFWQNPADALAAVADFAPIGGVIFTLGSAVSSWLLGRRLVEEFRNPLPRPSAN